MSISFVTVRGKHPVDDSNVRPRNTSFRDPEFALAYCIRVVALFVPRTHMDPALHRMIMRDTTLLKY